MADRARPDLLGCAFALALIGFALAVALFETEPGIALVRWLLASSGSAAHG